MRRITLLVAALVALPLVAAAQQPEAAPSLDRVVDIRQSKMGQSGGAVRALMQAASSDADLATVAPRVQWLVQWADELPTLFPEGSNSAGTDARPEVWSDHAGFTAAADRFRTSVQAVAAAAAANDRATLATRLGELRETCNTCHAAYKN